MPRHFRGRRTTVTSLADVHFCGSRERAAMIWFALAIATSQKQKVKQWLLLLLLLLFKDNQAAEEITARSTDEAEKRLYRNKWFSSKAKKEGKKARKIDPLHETITHFSNVEQRETKQKASGVWFQLRRRARDWESKD